MSQQKTRRANDMQMKRQTRRQKEAFRREVLEAFPNAYTDRHLLAKNIVIGNPVTAETIVSAHYDTPPKLPVWFVRHLTLFAMVGVPFLLMGWFEVMFRLPLWTMQPIIMSNLDMYFFLVMAIGYGAMAIYIAHLFGFTPFLNDVSMNDNTSGVAVVLDMANRNDPRFAFVLFDNEEKGLFGSLAFRKRYNDILKDKRIIVLDCIGVGDVLNLYTWGQKTDVADELLNLNDSVALDLKHKRSTLMSMSDHVAFHGLNTVLLLANHRRRWARWKFWKRQNSLATIHTSKDDYLKTANLYQVMRLIESV
jgi:hypothetical protein